MERRELFKVLAATTAVTSSAQHRHSESKVDLASYKPRYFTPAQYELLDHLCETILPADEEGGGAHDAGVSFYIDTIAFYSDKKAQQFWAAGLAGVDDLANKRFDRGFSALTKGEREQVVAALLENERSPKTDGERFAVRLKTAVIDAYGVSDVGMKYFRYKGNSATLTFPGCSHTTH